MVRDRHGGVGTVKQRFERMFVERELLLRAAGEMRYVALSRRRQMALFLLMPLVLGWIAFTTVLYFAHDRILAGKDREIDRVRAAYEHRLDDQAAELRQWAATSAEQERRAAERNARVAVLERRLAEAEDGLLQVVAEKAAAEKEFAALDATLSEARRDRDRIAEVRDDLARNLNTAEGEIDEMARRNTALHDEIGTLQAKLDTADGRIQLVESQRERLTKRLAGLEQRFTDLHETQADVLGRLLAQTTDNIDQVEQTLGQTGLDFNAMLIALKGDAAAVGIGGPFIAYVPEFDHPTDFEGEPGAVDPLTDLEKKVTALNVRVTRWEGLHDFMQGVPLAAPLDQYRISSGYGKRRDPITGKAAMHLGIDMGGARKSPVLAPAPGVVSFVGRRGNYGRTVEIDHGNGIVTRYGHLHSIMVKKGQTVEFRETIGRMGNTGRSTGTHLHYEVIANGRALHPGKFIEAGKYVLKGE